MRVGIDIRVADPLEPGQQRYLWRLGEWLAGQAVDLHYLTVKKQPAEVALPEGARLHRLEALSARGLSGFVGELALDALLLNPERSRRYRGVGANVLRSAYGTEHYRQKLRSFRDPVEKAIRQALRATPWEAMERRWERAFYEATRPTPRIVAQSSYMKAEILDSYRVPEESVTVIHNAVDTDEYAPERRLALRSEMRARFGIPDDAHCLLFLGHNFRLKGLWQILGAVARLESTRRVHVLAAGRGTGRHQRARADRMVRELGLEGRVTLPGPVRPSMHALAAADTLLHLSWHDAFGFVALEAMASGLPVVTTRFAGAAELVEEGVSGILVDPGSETSIVEAIRTLGSPETRAAMGRAAAEVGARHDEPRNFQRVFEVIQQAAREHGRPISVR